MRESKIFSAMLRAMPLEKSAIDDLEFVRRSFEVWADKNMPGHLWKRFERANSVLVNFIASARTLFEFEAGGGAE